MIVKHISAVKNCLSSILAISAKKLFSDEDPSEIVTRLLSLKVFGFLFFLVSNRGLLNLVLQNDVVGVHGIRSVNNTG